MSQTTPQKRDRRRIKPQIDAITSHNESLTGDIHIIDNETEMAKRQLIENIRNEPHKFLCREQAQQEKIKEFLGKNPFVF